MPDELETTETAETVDTDETTQTQEAAETVATEATETTETTEAVEDKPYTDEEWAALPEDERKEIQDYWKAEEEKGKATEAEDEHKYPPELEKIREEMRAEMRKEIDTYKAEVDQKVQQREDARNDLLRRRTTDLAEAAKAHGIKDLYDKLKSTDRPPETDTEDDFDFGKLWQDKTFIDPAKPPTVPGKTPGSTRQMTAEEIAMANRRMNNDRRAILSDVGKAIFDSPIGKSLIAMAHQNQTIQSAAADVSAWNDSITEAFKENGIQPIVVDKQGKPVLDESGTPQFTPEYRTVATNLRSLELVSGGARKDENSRRATVMRLLDMAPKGQTSTRETAKAGHRRLPDGVITPKKRFRRLPASQLAGSGQTASQAQGQFADNRAIMLSKA